MILKKVPGVPAGRRSCSVRWLCVFAAGWLPFTASAPAQSPTWTGSWATAPMASPQNEAQIDSRGETIRNLIHLSIGGRALRVRLSNSYGAKPLTVAEVHVAMSGGGGAIEAGTDHRVTFGGEGAVVIPAESVAVSDPVALQTAAFADLAISIFVPAQTDLVLTYHSQAIATNYVAAGNQVALPTLNNPSKVNNWYLVNGVDVDAGPHAASIVILGASVVNGTHSTMDKNRRWPDDLAVRLQSLSPTARLGVLNEGIGGNRILHNNTGLSGIARMDRDVLNQTNATFLVFSMGTNDIGRTFLPTDPEEKGVTAEQIEWAMQQAVWRAHARSMKVICATLNPYEGASYFSPDGERMRLAVNRFILSSNACDGIVDFDRVTRDPAHPSRLLPAYDSGDHLHPNDAGYQVMADAFNLEIFMH